MNSENIPCPLCDCKESRPVPFMDPEGGGSISREDGYHWRCCKDCGNAYPSRPVSLAEMQDYWDKNRVVKAGSNEEEIWEGRFREADIWAKRTWKILAPYITTRGGRFLDIACGLGATVKLFQDKGWHAEGLDADPNTQSAHKRMGIHVTIGQVEQLEYAERYDIISIAHAIYFVSDPKGFIKRVRTMLKPDGLFLVVLSDLLSAHSVGGPSYVHTWVPTEKSLSLVLQREGYRILSTTRIKGSNFILAKPLEKSKTEGLTLNSAEAFKIYLRHRTHRMRQIFIGTPRRVMARNVRYIMSVLRR